MATSKRNKQVTRTAHRIAQASLVSLGTLLAASALSGCLMIGGSSRGGFFIWPGGLGLAVLIIVLVMILRRR